MPRIATYNDYAVAWDTQERTLRIQPVMVHAGHTITFGLGDATVRINIGNPPTQIAQALMGESNAERFTKSDMFYVRRFVPLLEDVHLESKELHGYRNTSGTIHYPKAESANMKEMANDGQPGEVDVETVSYENTSRVGW